jgi:hypothetical protein
MIVLVSCNGYEVIREERSDADLPRLCREEEVRRDDGFAVVAFDGGIVIADAEGYADRCEGSPPHDSATATGMYDAW